MKTDLFKDLIGVVAALAVDEVVKLLDAKREPVADLAKLLYVDLGAAQHVVKRHPLEAQLQMLDSKRSPVADAAQFLHCDHAFTANWLRHHEAISITRYAGDLRTMSRERVAMTRLFEPVVFKADSFGILMNSDMYEPCDDGWSFRLKYPDRQKTADSAEYLWRNQVSGIWDGPLRQYSANEIRSMASRRQETLCEKVADAAWVCMDVGIWRPHHFINEPLLTSKRIIEAAEAIKSRISSEAPATRKMVAMLALEGYGGDGRSISVERIPVFNDSGHVGNNPESEFVVARAKEHGIEQLTGATTSFGPDIYQ